MIKDKAKELIKRTGLLESLKTIPDREGRECDYSREFQTDRENAHFYEVLSGKVRALTTWREMPESKDVIALMTLEEGDAVLYFAGEARMIVPIDGEVSHFVLE